MALTVNSNIQAMNAYRNLNKTQASLSSSLEKLSSGLRINRAADDAAGLAISEGFKAQIGGIQQASKNAQDGVSLVQTADGALSETQTILQRLRTLAVNSANGSQSDTSRSALNSEAVALKAELTRISQTSNFNGINLLDGTLKTAASFQIGYRADNTATGVTGNVIKVSLDSGAASAVATTATLAGVSATAASSVAYDFSGSNTLVVHVSLDGADQALTISANLSNATSATEYSNLAASLTAAASAAFGGSYLTFAAGASGNISVTEATSGAHTVKIVSVAGSTSIGAASIGLAVGTGAGFDAVTAGAFSVGGLGLGSLHLSTQAGAVSAITAIDTAITNVSNARANLGALQNRFQYTVDNLDTTSENLSSAESRVVDTDMASEMVNYTRASILSQAGTSMLSQAKNLPQSILDLLKS